jgi:predicted aspartyl protease
MKLLISLWKQHYECFCLSIWGKGKTKKEGKEIEVNIPATEILRRMGSFIQVTVTHPRSVAEKMQHEGKDVPTHSTNALIDTGASHSVISPEIVTKLHLVQTGFQKVTSVQDEQNRPVYFGYIQFPWGMGKETALVACPLQLKYAHVLIGRDILRHWHFIYNGIDGSITICD